MVARTGGRRGGVHGSRFRARAVGRGATLRAYILQRPVAAFKTLVMPLLPKDVRVDVASQRVVVWRSFMDEVGITTVHAEEVQAKQALEAERTAASSI